MRRVRFPCAICKKTFPKKKQLIIKGKKRNVSQIFLDHIEPVIDPRVGFPLMTNGEDNWNEYIKRLMGSSENIQVLCKACHDAKTLSEKQIKKEHKGKKK